MKGGWRQRLDDLIGLLLQGMGLVRISKPAAPEGTVATVAPSPQEDAQGAGEPPGVPSLTWWDRLWQKIFAIDLWTSRLRFVAAWVVFFGVWFGLALAIWPDSSMTSGRWMLYLQAGLATLFSGMVWRVLVILAAVTVAAYRWAAVYLDDIYELYDEAVAARFIRQAAFALAYEVIEIKDGDVAPEHRSSPIVRIGGPGAVVVHVENAAVFEKVDGTPHEIGPTAGEVQQGCLAKLLPMFFRSRRAADGVAYLEGFERLRAVVSLMPHQVTINMKARTREGVPVRVENVTAIYHVARRRGDGTLKQPYPFLENALINLVYNQEPPRAPGTQTIDHRKWARVAEGRLLRGALGSLVARHSLSEFLTTAGELEQQVLQEVAEELRQQAREFSGAATSVSALDSSGPAEEQQSQPEDLDQGAKDGRDSSDSTKHQPSLPFLDREHIRKQILTRAQEGMHRLGVTLTWSGTGTWQTPPEISVENHLKAWRISLANQIRGSQDALIRLCEQERIGTIIKMIREGPVQSFRRIRQSMWTEERQVVEMIGDYLHLLRPVVDRLHQRGGAGARDCHNNRRQGLVALIRAVDYLEALGREPPPWDWESSPEDE